MNARTHGKRAVVVDLRAAARELEATADKRSGWVAQVSGVRSLQAKARVQHGKAIAERSLAVLLERAAQVIESTESVRVDAARGQLVLLTLRKHGGAAIVTEFGGQLRLTPLPTGVGAESLAAHYAERADAAEAAREAADHALAVARRELEQLRAKSMEVAEKADVLRQVPSMMESLALCQRELRDTMAELGRTLQRNGELIGERNEAMRDADALFWAYVARDSIFHFSRANKRQLSHWWPLHLEAQPARERAAQRAAERNAAADACAEGWC